MPRLRLFDVQHERRRRGTTMALVALTPGVCPACGASLDYERVGQLPLIRHGGYGAVQQRTMAYCACGWTLITAVDEINQRVR